MDTLALKVASRFRIAARPPTYQIPGGPKVRVYDGGEEEMDRYTIVIDDKDWQANPGRKPMLGCGEGGRGVSQFTEGVEGAHLGKGIAFKDLSADTQRHVIFRLTKEGE
jgi:hypothetical protein